MITLFDEEYKFIFILPLVQLIKMLAIGDFVPTVRMLLFSPVTVLFVFIKLCYNSGKSRNYWK